MNIGFDDFSRMLDDFFGDTWPIRRNLQSDNFKVDVQEEVNLSLEDGRLRIAIQRDEEKEEKDKNYIHKERRYCSMERNIFLKEADSEGIR